MNPLEKKQLERIAPLFTGSQETMVWSCLEGALGEARAPCPDAPACARLLVGDFCFFGGDAGAPGAADLVRDFPAREVLLIPPDERWAGLIERVHGERAERFTRYAFRKDTAFDARRLEALAAEPAGCRVVPIDEAWYRWTAGSDWAGDFTRQYPDWAAYRAHGLGRLALLDGEPVAGASSYTHWSGGIEIEVDTREDCRRRGLATACAARLILDCLERGLYPSWDAANLSSVGLAEKLGYVQAGPYPAYDVKPK